MDEAIDCCDPCNNGLHADDGSGENCPCCGVYVNAIMHHVIDMDIVDNLPPGSNYVHARVFSAETVEACEWWITDHSDDPKVIRGGYGID